MDSIDDSELSTIIRDAISTELSRQGVISVADLDLMALSDAIEAALLRDDDDGLEPEELNAANDG